jgi:DNA-binding transcriptional MocR family regulator
MTYAQIRSFPTNPMPKRTTPTPHPTITLDATSTIPLYKQLYKRLRGAILAGQLARGARLPSTRTLASELGISRTTTALAYEQLLLEGFLESRVGQGTVVSRELPTDLLIEVNTPRKKTMQKRKPVTPLKLSTHVPLLVTLPPSNPVAQGEGIFRAGEAAMALFPYELWARLVARRARHSLRGVSRYQALAGYDPLRRAIAAHVGITRGVRCVPEQVIITSGSQGALDLAIRTLLNPGDAAWIENPGYFGAQGALMVAGARLIPVPVDEQGLDVEAGKRLCAEAQLVSTTPSHQFPTGVTMSLSRRLALLEWAHEQGAWILEDDYDSEYRYTGRPLEALQGLDYEKGETTGGHNVPVVSMTDGERRLRDIETTTHPTDGKREMRNGKTTPLLGGRLGGGLSGTGRVLYIGSFSKTLFPALRLGYLIAPPELVEPLVATRRFMDIHPPFLEQMVLTDFMEEGHFVRHLRRMLGHYQQRRDLLCHELNTYLGNILEVYTPEAGMHLVGWLPPNTDDRHLAARAAKVGLDLSAISKYSLTPLERGGLLFGYASTSEAGIREGVRRLKQLIVNNE